MKNLKQILFIVGVLSLSGCSSSTTSGGKDCGPDFNDTEGIKKFIVGKWHSDMYVIDHRRYYRFDITEDKIKYWVSTDESSWNTEADGEIGYTLGEVSSHYVEGECRRLILDEEVLALSMKGTALSYDYNSFDDCYTLTYDSALKRGW